MKPRGNARGLRIGTYIVGVAAVWFLRDGYFAHLLGGVITLVALVLYWLEGPRFFRLAMLWCGGFLLIITGEGLMDAESIARFAGKDAYDEASRYMVAAHLAALLGHDLTFTESAVRPMHDAIVLRIRSVLPLLVLFLLIALVRYLPVVAGMYAGGRVTRDVETATVGGAFFLGLAQAASVSTPILALWCARHTRGTSRQLLFAIAAGMFAVQFVVGVRFLLLFSALGGAIVWTAPRRLGVRVLAAFVAFGLVLWFATSVIRKTRTYGLASADLGAVVTTTSMDEMVLNEGVVKMMALAVVYTRLKGHTNGESSAAILVFWIPRALWEEKPTFMGHWLPRFFTTSGFSRGFSSAQGFAANAYVDFGFAGGVVMWIFGGVLFGLLERKVASICATPGDARVILVAPLFGATFFAVRTIDTTILVMLGVFICMSTVLLFAGRRRRTELGSE